MSQNNQSTRVDTGIVSPGKTCQYRTYINDTVSTPTFFSASLDNANYNVTVAVDYVYDNTYLGVYKYFKFTNEYELISEVDRNFAGNITTTMDTSSEIHVQMHPFSTESCAGFNVYADRTEDTVTSSDDGLHLGIIIAIVLVVVWGSLVLGSFG